MPACTQAVLGREVLEHAQSALGSGLGKWNRASPERTLANIGVVLVGSRGAPERSMRLGVGWRGVLRRFAAAVGIVSCWSGIISS